MAGTVGHKVLSGMKKIEIEKKVVWFICAALARIILLPAKYFISTDQCSSVSAIHVI